MEKMILVTFFVIGIANFASAEDFMCQGLGKFSGVGQQQVNLDWEKAYQKVLLETDSLKVQANIDKANSDGTHYLSIEVLETSANGAVTMRTAKGSIKDMVLYGEDTSIINCLPINQ